MNSFKNQLEFNQSFFHLMPFSEEKQIWCWRGHDDFKNALKITGLSYFLGSKINEFDYVRCSLFSPTPYCQYGSIPIKVNILSK